MVPLRVLTLIVVEPAQPSVLVLEPVEPEGSSERMPGKSRVVPIWIGPNEAAQLNIALNRVKLPRPTTHDLFLDALTNLDARVDHVLIDRIDGKVFSAKLTLWQAGRLVELDARPTDALALAIRQQAPFYIMEDVLEKASFPYLVRMSLPPEEELEVFRSFLEDVSPEDFNLQG